MVSSLRRYFALGGVGRLVVTLATHCLRAASLDAPSMAHSRMPTLRMPDSDSEEALPSLPAAAAAAAAAEAGAGGVEDAPRDMASGTSDRPVGSAADGASVWNRREGLRVALARPGGLVQRPHGHAQPTRCAWGSGSRTRRRARPRR
jgi:hypothetical protein